MSAADAAWFYKPKRGRYRRRSVVRFGTKARKVAYRPIAAGNPQANK
jgi:hypothetical protein